jgi:RNA polymerase sigma-70 factor (ECF subfamily)
VALNLAENLESTLVERAQQGDRGAYADLVRLHYPGVIRAVYALCGNTQVAEDAAQEAFLRAWLHLSEYRPGGSLRSWLYRIAVNAALDMLRRETRIAPSDLDELSLTDHQAGPEASYLEAEKIALVRQAVAALPPASRAVLILREYSGLSYQEIAIALDIPIGTVMSRLNYARGQLREKLRNQLEPQVEIVEVANA